MTLRNKREKYNSSRRYCRYSLYKQCTHIFPIHYLHHVRIIIYYAIIEISTFDLFLLMRFPLRRHDKSYDFFPTTKIHSCIKLSSILQSTEYSRGKSIRARVGVQLVGMFSGSGTMSSLLTALLQK